jgi:hypothetical protein
MTHTISIVEPAQPESVYRETHTLNLIDYWFLTRASIKKEKEIEKLKVMECVYTYSTTYIFLIFCVLYYIGYMKVRGKETRNSIQSIVCHLHRSIHIASVCVSVQTLLYVERFENPYIVYTHIERERGNFRFSGILPTIILLPIRFLSEFFFFYLSNKLGVCVSI